MSSQKDQETEDKPKIKTLDFYNNLDLLSPTSNEFTLSRADQSL
jgi:hypothetical protein